MYEAQEYRNNPLVARQLFEAMRGLFDSINSMDQQVGHPEKIRNTADFQKYLKKQADELVYLWRQALDRREKISQSQMSRILGSTENSTISVAQRAAHERLEDVFNYLIELFPNEDEISRVMNLRNKLAEAMGTLGLVTALGTGSGAAEAAQDFYHSLTTTEQNFSPESTQPATHEQAEDIIESCTMLTFGLEDAFGNLRSTIQAVVNNNTTTKILDKMLDTDPKAAAFFQLCLNMGVTMTADLEADAQYWVERAENMAAARNNQNAREQASKLDGDHAENIAYAQNGYREGGEEGTGREGLADDETDVAQDGGAAFEVLKTEIPAAISSYLKESQGYSPDATNFAAYFDLQGGSGYYFLSELPKTDAASIEFSAMIDRFLAQRSGDIDALKADGFGVILGVSQTVQNGETIGTFYIKAVHPTEIDGVHGKIILPSNDWSGITQEAASKFDTLSYSAQEVDYIILVDRNLANSLRANGYQVTEGSFLALSVLRPELSSTVTPVRILTINGQKFVMKISESNPDPSLPQYNPEIDVAYAPTAQPLMIGGGAPIENDPSSSTSEIPSELLADAPGSQFYEIIPGELNGKLVARTPFDTYENPRYSYDGFRLIDNHEGRQLLEEEYYPTDWLKDPNLGLIARAEQEGGTLSWDNDIKAYRIDKPDGTAIHYLPAQGTESVETSEGKNFDADDLKDGWTNLALDMKTSDFIDGQSGLRILWGVSTEHADYNGYVKNEGFNTLEKQREALAAWAQTALRYWPQLKGKTLIYTLMADDVFHNDESVMNRADFDQREIGLSPFVDTQASFSLRYGNVIMQAASIDFSYGDPERFEKDSIWKMMEEFVWITEKSVNGGRHDNITRPDLASFPTEAFRAMNAVANLPDSSYPFLLERK